MSRLADLRVALVHDWLVTVRGGERVLDALCELFPAATVHTLIRVPGAATPRIEAMRHVSSWADVAALRPRHRWGLPAYLLAVEGFDLSDFDLVVSSSHLCAKAVIAGPGATHVCYSHTPVRYAWDRLDDYIQGGGPALRLARPLLARAAAHLRDWDARTAGRVDAFVANSAYVADKIARFYGRHADVVHPPVDAAPFLAAARPDRADYDLLLGALVPYKRVDLAVEAYRALPERRLVVAGEGPERTRLQRAAPPNVSFVGRIADVDLPAMYAAARLLVFPGEEDFGIVPLEAQAAGTPVVALGRGGARESVRDGVTGAWFDPATPAALADAVRRCDALALRPEVCRQWAATFDRPAFLVRMERAIDRAVAARIVGGPRQPPVTVATGR